MVRAFCEKLLERYFDRMHINPDSNRNWECIVSDSTAVERFERGDAALKFMNITI